LGIERCDDADAVVHQHHAALGIGGDAIDALFLDNCLAAL
jgi:hypothetical protein